ncbi:MAG TPA: hypothetical protein VJ259_02085, partial [Actinomycetota bacterium]|nr:hypothetical protein [Actinomycetota bacterium]
NLTAVAPVKFVPSITTSAPTGPEVGENDVIVGAPAAVTVKFWALVPVPPGVVTLIFPVVAPEGTVAVICVPVLTVNVVAAVLLNVTAVAPVKLVPVITTGVPTGPLVGLKLVTVGAPANTVKFEELVSVPFGVVTVMGPVAAPEGTVAVIWSDEFTVNDALTLLKNFTELAPSKFEPEIVTETPTAPPLGVKDEIVGSSVAVTTKSSVLVPVPSGFVTEMGPVWALLGTIAVIWFGLSTSNVADRFGANVTVSAPVKFDPLMTTDVPPGPLSGVKPETVGAAASAAVAGSTRSRSVATRSSATRRMVDRAFIGTPPGLMAPYGASVCLCSTAVKTHRT